MVRLAEQRGDLLFQELTSSVDLLNSIGIVLYLDQIDCTIEVLLVAVHLRVQVPRISLHVVPISQIPRRIYSHGSVLLDHILDLTLLGWVLLSQVLVPHVLNEL